MELMLTCLVCHSKFLADGLVGFFSSCSWSCTTFPHKSFRLWSVFDSLESSGSDEVPAARSSEASLALLILAAGI